MRPVVVLEFGARSTGEPSERRPVTCDAAAPSAGSLVSRSGSRGDASRADLLGKGDGNPRPLRGGRFRGTERFSQHWYDLACLSHRPSRIGPQYIINFPTKRHWRGKSRIKDIESGLHGLANFDRSRLTEGPFEKHYRLRVGAYCFSSHSRSAFHRFRCARARSKRAL